MRRSILFLVVIFIGNACTEGITPKPYTESQLISGKTSKTWKLDKLVTRVDGKTDSPESLATCEKDDRYIFYANSEKLFEVKNGLNKCDPDEDDELVSYTWAFNNATASLSMVVPHVFGYYYIPFTVKSVDSNDLELEVFINEEATVSYALYFSKVEEN